MSTIDSFLDAKPSANIDSFLGPEPRSAVGEIANQLAGGALVELPEQTGKALQYTGEKGDALYDVGTKIREYGESNAPGYEPQPDQHNIVTNALAGGARMIAPSIAPAAAVTGAIALAPVSVPTAIAAGAGALATGAMFGAAQGQETYEKGVKAGIPEDEAKTAGRINALIEGGGETLGTLAFAKLFGLGARAASKATETTRTVFPGGSRTVTAPVERTAGQAALDAAKDTSVVAPWARELPKTAVVEVGTEIGQNAGEAAVEQAYGIDNQSPVDAGLQAIAPTLGMTALLAPFGLIGHGIRARGIQKRMDALADPETSVEERAALSDQIAAELHAADPQAARAWQINAAQKIAANKPITLEDAMLSFEHADTIPEQPTAHSEGAQAGGEQEPARVPQDDAATVANAMAPDAGPLARAAGVAAMTGATQHVRDQSELEQADQLEAAYEAERATTRKSSRKAAYGVIEKAISGEYIPAAEARAAEAQAEQPAQSVLKTKRLAISSDADMAARGSTASEPSTPAAATSNASVATSPSVTQPADAAATQAATTAPALPRAVARAENSAVPEERAAPAEPPTPTALEAARTAANLSANRESPASSIPPASRSVLRNLPIVSPVDQAAHEAATSPRNELPEPTEPQKDAGNYQKGHARIGGLDISIENPQGSQRRPEWPTLKSHYGYIRGTVGNDKSHIDAFVKPGTPEDYDGPVFVVDQQRPLGGKFDEHKILLGWPDEASARAGYTENYTKGWRGLKSITQTSIPELRQWFQSGETTKEFAPWKAAQPTAVAKPQQLFVQWGGFKVDESSPAEPVQRFPVTSIDDARAKWEQFRDKTGAGGSQIGNGVRVTDQDGNFVARISYNGRVWNTDDAPVKTASGTALEDRAAEARDQQPTNDEQGASPEDTKAIAEAFDGVYEGVINGGDQITHVFDPPTNKVRLQDKVKVYHKDHGWMTPEQAKAAIAKWKEHAAAQGKTRANSNKVVISLFDLSGQWSKPWEDAGYAVFRFDIQAAAEYQKDIREFSAEYFGDEFGAFNGDDVHAILAAVPCTDFAVSGAKHFAAKDADGRTVESVKLVEMTLATIEYFKPSVWAIENPVGRIEKLGRLPPWRLSFDPNHFGDPYTKKTLLWGRFNADLPVAPVEPTEGSKMFLKYGGKSLATKNARSVTPEGFAYAFFMANNAIDHPVMAIANKYDRLSRSLIERAVEAGVTAEQIDRAVEDHYWFDMDDAAANDAVRALLPKQPTPPAEAPKQSVLGANKREAAAPAATEPASAAAQEPRAADAAHVSAEDFDKLIDDVFADKPTAEPRTDDYGHDVGKEPAAAAKPEGELEKGDRVEIIDGEFKGRHGVISDKTVFRTVTVPIFGPRGAETEMRSVHYTVTTDGGAESYASPESIRREMAKPDKAAPDVKVDGKFQTPEQVKRSIAHAKAQANGFRAKAGRARIDKNRREHLQSAATEDQRAVNLQALYDNWARANGVSVEAPKVAPAPATTLGSADVPAMTMHQQKHGKTGEQLFIVNMNDRQPRDVFERMRDRAKEFNGYYSNFSAARGFTFKSEDDARAFMGQGETPAPKTGGQILGEAAGHAGAAVKAGFAGLDALFGRKGQLGSGPVFDENTWEQAKPHFKAAFDEFVATGKSLRDFVVYIRDTYNGSIIPYLKRWHQELVAEAENGRSTERSPGQDDHRGRDDGQRTDAVREPEGERDAGTSAERPSGDVSGDGQRSDVEVDGSAAADEQSGSARQGGGGSGRRNARGTRSGSGDSARVPARRKPRLPDGIADYHPAPGALDRTGGWKKQATTNLDIIELVKKLEAESRYATPEEQAVLAKWTGWGASEMAQGLFVGPTSGSALHLDPSWARSEWRELVTRAKALMTPDEAAAAARSTQYAHYTSEPVIRSMWTALQRMGFKGGRIIEPGMGTGLFPIFAPEDLAKASVYTGIEFEPFTAKIAKYLLPEQNVVHGDFTKYRAPPAFFDVAIGNPPFAKTIIETDPEYRRYRFSLHDFMFAKTVDRVRPGGILAFVTSRYTMDKGNDRARQYLAGRADLIGAIRLPDTAFQQNAGTEVVTDILFLRRREPGAEPAGEKWLGLGDVAIGDKTAMVNEYFVAHPEMVLGKHSLEGKMYARETYTVKPAEGELATQLAAAVARLPENVLTARKEVEREKYERDLAPTGEREGALYVGDDGNVYRREFGTGRRLEELRGRKGEPEWFKSYIGLRDAMRQARTDQVANGEWEKSLKALNKTYDAFVKEHGNLLTYTDRESVDVDEDGNSKTVIIRRYKNETRFAVDADGPLVAALERIDENGDIKKGAFLLGRTLAPPEAPKIETVHDALAVSLSDVGRLDLGHIAGLLGKIVDDVIAELGDLIYYVPSGEWQMADEYLSGDVVKKLDEAKAAAEVDPAFERNVAALIKAQPKPLGSSDIDVGLGAHWVPVHYYEEFAEEVLGTNVAISRSAIGSWDVGVATAAPTYRRSVKKQSARAGRQAGGEWSTDKRSPIELLDAAINSRSVKITYTDENKKTFTDEAGTAEANDKVKKMRETFGRWIWQDADRASDLLELYNRSYNNLADRQFDGSHLRLPGLSLRYNLYPHQKRAIWRAIQTGNTYFAHAVGAGKTLEMIVSAMEQRRLGLIRLPMFTVPRHMLNQFAAEYLDAYPNADIMVASPENFGAKERKRFIAQAAMNKPDAIVISHSTFGLIKPDPKMTRQVLDDLIGELQAALEEIDSEAGMAGKRRRKQIEQRIEQLEQRFLSRTGEGDDLVTLEEMGVDFLYVDEAHEFRKLDFYTNRQNVKGITPEGAKRSLDLYIKTRALGARRPGRSHILASGTPITNTLAELYSIQRYMDENALRSDGFLTFDDWAAQFGKVESYDERNAAGTYEVIERFAGLVNVPELMTRVRTFMDVLTMTQLKDKLKLPTIRGGKPEIVVSETTAELREYMEALKQRIDVSRKWKPTPEQPGNPDPLINIITDARLASIDTGFINGGTSNPNSKLNKMIDSIVAEYKATKDRVYTSGSKADSIKGGGQIVFSSVGFGAQVAKARNFDIRAYTDRRLAKAGVKPSEIAWMSDYDAPAKKEAMFRSMREGRVRILFGSPKNMGTGLNVQKRLTMEHYLSPPWYPADEEQPRGRILRQGNQNDEIGLSWYATKETYDSTQWQMVARKQRFIEKAMTGSRDVRRLEDVSESSLYETASALASGDERVIRYTRLKRDIDNLELLRRAHAENDASARWTLRTAEAGLRQLNNRKAELEAAIAAGAGKLVMSRDAKGTIGGAQVESATDVGKALLMTARRETKANPPAGEGWREHDVGELNGARVILSLADLGRKMFPEFNFRVALRWGDFTTDSLMYSTPLNVDLSEPQIAALGSKVLEGHYGVQQQLNEVERTIDDRTEQIESAKARIGLPFDRAGELGEKIAEAATLRSELLAVGAKDKPADEVAPTEDVEQAADQIERGEKPEGDLEYSITPYALLGRKPEARLDPRFVNLIVDRFRKRWPGAPQIVVAPNPRDLGAPDGVTGAHDRSSGKVYIVASNIRSIDHLYRVLAHEAVGHASMQEMLGDGGFAAIVKEIQNAKRRGDPNINRLAQEVFETHGSLGLTPEQEASEIIARATEHAVDRNGNVRPEWAWFGKVLSYVRQFLRETLGIPVEFTNLELAGLIARAAERVETAQPERPTPGGNAAPALQQSREFSMGAGEATIAARAPWLERAAEILNDVTRSQKTIGLWGSTVGTMRNLAYAKNSDGSWKHPDFRRVYNRVQEYIESTSRFTVRAADLAQTIIPRTDNLAAAARNVLQARRRAADMERVSTLLFEGTLNDKREFGADELKGMGLNPAQVEMYQQARAAINQSVRDLASTEMVRVAKAANLWQEIDPHAGIEALHTYYTDYGHRMAEETLAELNALPPDDPNRARLSNRVATIREAIATIHRLNDRAAQLTDEGYAPLMRFGRYVVDVYHVDEDGQILRDEDGNAAREEFLMFDHERRANAAARELRRKHAGDPSVVVIQSVVNPDAYKRFAGMTPETLALFAHELALDQDEAFREYLTLAVSQRSAMQRMFQRRKGIAGFSEDLPRVLAAFITSNARRSSTNVHMGELTKAVSDVRNGEEQRIAQGLAEYVRDPSEEANKLRGFLFFHFLSGSVASAVTNVAGGALMLAPYLHQYTAGTKIGLSRILASAAKMAVAGTDDPEMKRAALLAGQMGLTQPMEVHQLHAEAAGSTLGRNPYMRSALHVAAAPFAAAETFNRRMTFYAAWQVAKEKGIADPMEFVEQAIAATQGVYNKGNRPVWSRGPIGGVVFTFKQFSIAYAEFLVRLPVQQRAIALALLVVASGIRGLPFEEDVEDLIDTILQALGFNFTTKKKLHEWATATLGETGGQILLHGFSAIPGMPIDMQARLGFGNMIPGTSILKQSETDKTRDILEAIGPVGGVVKQASTAFAQVLAGDYGKAVESAAPIAIGNIIKATDMASTGFYTDQRGRRVAAVDFTDAVVKGFGFQPQAIAAESRRVGEQMQTIALSKTTEDNIVQTWAEGIVSHDAARVQEALAELRSYNAKNPEAPIRITPAQVQQRVRNMLELRAQRFTKSAPPELRGAIGQAVR